MNYDEAQNRAKAVSTLAGVLGLVAGGWLGYLTWSGWHWAGPLAIAVGFVLAVVGFGVVAIVADAVLALTFVTQMAKRIEATEQPPYTEPQHKRWSEHATRRRREMQVGGPDTHGQAADGDGGEQAVGRSTS